MPTNGRLRSLEGPDKPSPVKPREFVTVQADDQEKQPITTRVTVTGDSRQGQCWLRWAQVSGSSPMRRVRWIESGTAGSTEGAS